MMMYRFLLTNTKQTDEAPKSHNFGFNFHLNLSEIYAACRLLGF